MFAEGYRARFTVVNILFISYALADVKFLFGSSYYHDTNI
jgi:hypothetical protein